MKKILAGFLIGVSALAATACTPTQEGAAIGAGTGALVGTAIDGGGLGGALVGAAVGTAAGALIGRAAEGNNKCYYRDRYGREYTDTCPPGYR
ncbi:YMGG-like glycine zipper-containing protein [Martelella endophytica]|uniref:Membrane protein n=1 Tax=Martelella endophytica TaxID=1486262 RepID=A0A0D5LP76_MAREN|nr:YMGG-like glycine zipper-containing protein [Martelella endophytica]AJY45755.1 membrane protein [Martelella endophytica]